MPFKVKCNKWIAIKIGHIFVEWFWRDRRMILNLLFAFNVRAKWMHCVYDYIYNEIEKVFILCLCPDCFDLFSSLLFHAHLLLSVYLCLFIYGCLCLCAFVHSCWSSNIAALWNRALALNACHAQNETMNRTEPNNTPREWKMKMKKKTMHIL